MHGIVVVQPYWLNKNTPSRSLDAESAVTLGYHRNISIPLRASKAVMDEVQIQAYLPRNVLKQ